MIIARHPVTVHCVHPGVVRTGFGANMRVSELAPVDSEQTAKLFERAARTSPEAAARLILRGVEKNRARILIGGDGRAAAAAPRLLGARYLTLFARATRWAESWTVRRNG